jgi:hypothetical protein
MHIMGPFTPDFLEVVDVLTPILTYVCNKEAGRLEAISILEREALQKAREEERKTTTSETPNAKHIKHCMTRSKSAGR